MYSKVLMPLDGSQMAECTLEHVKAIASGCNTAEVILLRITPPAQEVRGYGSTAANFIAPSDAEKQAQSRERAGFALKYPAETEWAEGSGRAHAQAEQQAEATAYMANVERKLKKDGLPVTTVILGDSNVSQAIMDYAEQHNVELIILSTHGRSGISRWAFGSTADRIVRHSRTPVLIVTPRGCRIS